MGSVWSRVVGQSRAVDRLQRLATSNIHSYLLIGQEGCGKDHAARAFATTLVTGSDDDSSREADLIMRGEFADVNEIVRIGPAIDKDEAEQIVAHSITTPLEARLKVIVIHDVHLMRESAAVRLLKTIEEPAKQVVFILLADQFVPSLTTIHSRCVVINFVRLTDTDIANELISNGVFPATAKAIANASNGNLDRARLLINDSHLARRQEAFASISSRLDGTGSAVVQVVTDLMEHLVKASEALLIQHEEEIKQLEQRIALTGDRGSGRKNLVDRHKREVRKLKTDELRSGLTTFAQSYKELLVTNPNLANYQEVITAIGLIHSTISSIGLNTNESLALHALLLKCPTTMHASASIA